MKCARCNLQAVVTVTESDGRKYGLCDLHDRLDDAAQAADFHRTAAALNLVTGLFNAQYGQLVPTIPKIELPPPEPVVIGALNLGNVHVSHSNVGVINTGMISRVESAIGNLQHAGNSTIAGALAELVEATKAAPDLSVDQKNAITEQLSSIADEAQQPIERRRLSLVRSAVGELSTYLGGAASVSALWESYGETIRQYFGL